MGFAKVYKSLQEVFPLVDIRLLKAVAIEHAKDVSTAVEVVLTEILPYMTKSPSPPVSPQENQGLASTSTSAGGGVPEPKSTTDQVLVEVLNSGPSSKQGEISSETVNDIDHSSSVVNVNSRSLDVAAVHCSSVSNLSDANDGHGPVVGHTETELFFSVEKGSDINVNGVQNIMSDEKSIASINESDADKYQEPNIGVVRDQMSHVTSTYLIHEDGGVSCSAAELLKRQEEVDWLLANDLNTDAHLQSHQIGPCLDHTPLEIQNSRSQASPQDHSQFQDAFDCDLQSENDFGAAVADCETPETSGVSDNSINQDNSIHEMLGVEDEPALDSLVTRSGQICSMDLLEDIIEDAKSNKKKLFSVMESVINMMKEVELKEKFAEEAKEQAMRGGIDILSKTEELKKMLQHAKEANDMHAGEVYGEKSILATEARELQSRLLNLSDERDKSLAILDEMRQTLEERLAAAEEALKAAEQEKLDKEESARRALAEQEDVMDKVVQESKRLLEEAEENSKLREFLVDRGRTVDILQGEISVICQDVRLLKDRFDERVPLSQSVSSSQTSCILASSSSSLKSVGSVQLVESVQVTEQQVSSETLEKRSPSPSIDGQSPKSSPVKSRNGDERNALLDDGWDLFDKDDVAELDAVFD